MDTAQTGGFLGSGRPVFGPNRGSAPISPGGLIMWFTKRPERTWCVEYVDCAGRPHIRWFETRAEAEAFVAELRAFVEIVERFGD